jgi:Polyketide cyclase / dehydrase and lipid transport
MPATLPSARESAVGELSMRVVRASIVVPGRAVEAEQLWYDRSRWASWIDGFAAVIRLEGEWPLQGSRRLWNSPPGGRGLVSERVTRYEIRVGQELDVEDEKLQGTLRVRFEPGHEQTRITLEYELEPKERMPPLGRYLLRRRLGDSARRTLTRFSYELAAERQFGRGR